MNLDVKEVTPPMWAAFAPLMREEDAAEWAAYSGFGPNYLLTNNWYPPLSNGENTVCRLASTEDGVPLCVWGVSPMPNPLDKRGWVWLVASPECVPVARYMSDYLFAQLKELRALYPDGGLTTESWINNPIHQMWLNWLGFKSGPKVIRNGSIFIPYDLLPDDQARRQ